MFSQPRVFGTSDTTAVVNKQNPMAGLGDTEQQSYAAREGKCRQDRGPDGDFVAILQHYPQYVC